MLYTNYMNNFLTLSFTTFTLECLYFLLYHLFCSYTNRIYINNPQGIFSLRKIMI